MPKILHVTAPTLSRDTPVTTVCAIFLDKASIAIRDHMEPRSLFSLKEMGFAETDPGSWCRDARFALTSIIARTHDLAIAVPESLQPIIDILAYQALLDGVPLVIEANGQYVRTQLLIGDMPISELTALTSSTDTLTIQESTNG